MAEELLKDAVETEQAGHLPLRAVGERAYAVRDSTPTACMVTMSWAH